MEIREAKDPNTTPVRLVELSESEDDEVVAAVTEHPNTPIHVLLQLAARFPSQFLRNPLFPMLVLEQPNFLHAASEGAIYSLLMAPESSAWLPEVVSRHPDSKARAILGRHYDHKRGSWPLLLQMLAQDPNKDVRQGVAWNPSAPAELLQALTQDKDEYVRGAVAMNQGAPPALLRAMAQSHEFSRHLAYNPSTPPDILETLAREESLRPGVAGNAGALLPMLEVFAQDDWWLVREAVAKNKKAPLSLLQALSQDPHPEVRRAVVENPHTPEELLRVLAQDENEEVRQLAAEFLPHESTEEP